MADETDLTKIVCVDRMSGATMDLDDGKPLVYLLRLGGLTMADKSQTPLTVYAFDVNDLATLITRMFTVASEAGDGRKLFNLMAANLGMDDEVLAHLRASVDGYFRRN